jgi:hypothetical protein
MIQHDPGGFLANPAEFLALLSRYPGQEHRGQRNNLLRPFPQRRKKNPADIQPVKKVLPETPMGCSFGKLALLAQMIRTSTLIFFTRPPGRTLFLE